MSDASEQSPVQSIPPAGDARRVFVLRLARLAVYALAVGAAAAGYFAHLVDAELAGRVVATGLALIAGELQKWQQLPPASVLALGVLANEAGGSLVHLALGGSR